MATLSKGGSCLRIVACLSPILLPACGYALVRGDAPFGIHRIAVIPFQEDEPVGLSAEISRELATLLAADGVALTSDRAAAEGVLTGTVLTAGTSKSPVAAAGARIPAYRIRLRVRARLLDGARELWSTEITVDDSFLPSGRDATDDQQMLETEANRRRALSRLATRIARSVHQQLVVDGSAGAGEG